MTVGYTTWPLESVTRTQTSASELACKRLVTLLQHARILSATTTAVHFHQATVVVPRWPIQAINLQVVLVLIHQTTPMIAVVLKLTSVHQELAIATLW